MTQQEPPEASPSLEQQKDAYKAILKTPDEKVVRAIIAEKLGLPAGESKHEALVSFWKECREKYEGWQVVQTQP